MAVPKIPLSKMDQLVADTRAELISLGIDTDGKRSDEILKMAREERNRPHGPRHIQKPKPE